MLKKLLIVAALLTVLILIAGVVLWIRQTAPVQHRYFLSNGSILTFNQATFGTNHVVSAGGRWERILPKFVRSWRKRPGSSSSFTTPSPIVVMWFERSSPALGGGQDFTCTLVHADGTEVPFAPSRHFARPTPTNALEGVPTPYPQHEANLRVRVYEQRNYDTAALLGEFTLRNPQVSRAPIPSAPALPQTSSDGDLRVTLESLETAVPRSRWEKTNSLRLWTHARMRVQQNGVPTANWSPASVVAIDSTGAKISSHSWSSGSANEIETLHFQPLLWPSETYKIRFELSRKPTVNFATNETWTVRGVAVPTNGGFTLVNTQRNLGAFSIQFHGLNSPSGQPPWDKLYGGEASLGFTVTPPPKEHRFTLVRITDDRGRVVETSGFGSSDTKYGLGIRAKTNAQFIDFTVALHRSRFVEFNARPARWDGTFPK